MNQKTLKIMGWIATCTAMLMYISYFPQIINNIHRAKSGFLQPMVAAINCTLWVTMVFFKRKRLAYCGSEFTRCNIWCHRCNYRFIDKIKKFNLAYLQVSYPVSKPATVLL